MPIRVLSTRGRVLRPLSPAKAVREVNRGQARWLHALKVEANRCHGTIVMARSLPLEREPERREMVQVFDADGSFLGWVGRYAALYSLKVLRSSAKERFIVVGDEQEMNGILFAAPASEEAKAEIRRVEARRVGVALLDRERIRQKLLKAVRAVEGSSSDLDSAALWRQAEEAIIDLTVKHQVQRGAQALALEELRRLRREMQILDMEFAEDMAPICQALVGQAVDEVTTGLKQLLFSS